MVGGLIDRARCPALSANKARILLVHWFQLRKLLKSLPVFVCVCVRAPPCCCVLVMSNLCFPLCFLSLVWTTGQRMGHGIWYCSRSNRLSSFQTAVILFTVSSGPLLTSVPLSSTHELTLLQANRHTWTQTHTSADRHRRDSSDQQISPQNRQHLLKTIGIIFI